MIRSESTDCANVGFLCVALTEFLITLRYVCHRCTVADNEDICSYVFSFFICPFSYGTIGYILDLPEGLYFMQTSFQSSTV